MEVFTGYSSIISLDIVDFRAETSSPGPFRLITKFILLKPSPALHEAVSDLICKIVSIATYDKGILIYLVEM